MLLSSTHHCSLWAFIRANYSIILLKCVCRVVRNSNYGWRALRLLSRRSPHFFQPTNQQFKSLEDYLENMVIKLAKELPVSHTFYFSTHVIFYIVCVFVYSFIFVTEGPPFWGDKDRRGGGRERRQSAEGEQWQWAWTNTHLRLIQTNLKLQAGDEGKYGLSPLIPL